MAKRTIKAGAVDQSIDIFVQDSSSTIGAGLAALVYNSASLVCYYRKGHTGALTQLTLVTQTVTGAHADGGFVQIDATNAKGMYRLDLSDTVVAATPSVFIYLFGAANMAPVVAEIEIVAVNPFDAVRMGMTALPNAAAEAAAGLFTRGTGAGQINQTANGSIALVSAVSLVSIVEEVQLVDLIAAGGIAANSFAAGAINAAAIAADAITDAKVASDVTIASVTGAVGSVTGNVGGSVASVASGGITTASFAAGAVNAAATSADFVTEIQSGIATSANQTTILARLGAPITYIATTDNAKTIIEAAAAGTILELAAGTHALAANVVRIPAGCILRGQGMGVTIITSTAVTTGAVGALVSAGNNCLLEDFTVQGTAASGNFQAIVGYHATSQASSTGVICRRVRAIGDSDAFFFNAGGTPATDTGRWTFIDCVGESKFDAATLVGDGSLAVHNYINCKLWGRGPTTVSSSFNGGGTKVGTRTITGTGGRQRFFNCDIYGEHYDTDSLTPVYGVDVRTTAEIELNGCRISTRGFDSGGSRLGVERDINITTSTATVSVSNTVYDLAKTANGGAGTFTRLPVASGVNVTHLSDDSTAVDNAESFFDGTGYVGTNNVIPTITTYTGNTPQTGDAFLRLATYRLSELLASDLASVPFATSLFGDLTEADGAVQRLTTNALEQAPAGGGGGGLTAGQSTKLDEIHANVQT